MNVLQLDDANERSERKSLGTQYPDEKKGQVTTHREEDTYSRATGLSENEFDPDNYDGPDLGSPPPYRE